MNKYYYLYFFLLNINVYAMIKNNNAIADCQSEQYVDSDDENSKLPSYEFSNQASLLQANQYNRLATFCAKQYKIKKSYYNFFTQVDDAPKVIDKLANQLNSLGIIKDGLEIIQEYNKNVRAFLQFLFNSNPSYSDFIAFNKQLLENTEKLIEKLPLDQLRSKIHTTIAQTNDEINQIMYGLEHYIDDPTLNLHKYAQLLNTCKQKNKTSLNALENISKIHDYFCNFKQMPLKEVEPNAILPDKKNLERIPIKFISLAIKFNESLSNFKDMVNQKNGGIFNNLSSMQTTMNHINIIIYLLNEIESDFPWTNLICKKCKEISKKFSAKANGLLEEINKALVTDNNDTCVDNSSKDSFNGPIKLIHAQIDTNKHKKQYPNSLVIYNSPLIDIPTPFNNIFSINVISFNRFIISHPIGLKEKVSNLILPISFNSTEGKYLLLLDIISSCKSLENTFYRNPTGYIFMKNHDNTYSLLQDIFIYYTEKQADQRNLINRKKPKSSPKCDSTPTQKKKT